MVDDPAHLVLDRGGALRAEATPRVAIDIDAGLRIGPLARRARSARRCTTPPRSSTSPATSSTAASRLVGVMTYEGQVAGVPDDVPRQRAKSPRRAQAQVGLDRPARGAPRAQIVAAAERASPTWSSGTPAGPAASSRRWPTRSSPRSRPGRACSCPGSSTTTVSFEPRPAAFFGVPVVRRPHRRRGHRRRWRLHRQRAQPARTALPLPWAPPGLHLTGLEGAGEVQTPLTGPGAHLLPDRRLGVVPARQVRRAGRAHQPGAPAGRGAKSSRRCRRYRGLGLAW